ncbi:hypothetical protein C5167_048234 [Papaver somniferum]|uniref:Uncharacterized protein n=1 Tax=Papaver somniferum TaxID=3469 RepID=A0A4Y7KLJ9_PAPSO|nr:hypothetical protein C5167_048234 [Papaver somniferum]
MITSYRNMLNNKEGKDKIDIVKSSNNVIITSFQVKVNIVVLSSEHRASGSFLHNPMVITDELSTVLEAVREHVLEMKDERNKLYISNSLNFNLCMLGVKILNLVPNSANFMACKLAKYCMSASYLRQWDCNSIIALLINFIKQERNNVSGTVSIG